MELTSKVVSRRRTHLLSEGLRRRESRRSPSNRWLFSRRLWLVLMLFGVFPVLKRPQAKSSSSVSLGQKLNEAFSPRGNRLRRPFDFRQGTNPSPPFASNHHLPLLSSYLASMETSKKSSYRPAVVWTVVGFIFLVCAVAILKRSVRVESSGAVPVLFLRAAKLTFLLLPLLCSGSASTSLERPANRPLGSRFSLPSVLLTLNPSRQRTGRLSSLPSSHQHPTSPLSQHAGIHELFLQARPKEQGG